MKIISGENFKEICELNVMHSKSFQTNKNGKKIILYQNFEKKILDIKFVNFCTHLLEEKNLPEKLNLMEEKFILIFHNSDHHFKKEHLQIFDKVPNLQKIYTQNCEIEDERVIPIPIGIANSKWPHGNLKIFNQILSENIVKKNKIYFHFNIGTNRIERKDCFDKIKKKGVKWLPNKNYQSFLRILKSHQFAISPPGNGVDCHRLWESLYMKVVPICKRSFLTEHFSKIFPIIILDDWNDLDISKLNYDDYSWENYDKLDFDWWKEKILKSI